MAIDPKIVDKVLGTGAYEDFQNLHDLYDDEWERAQNNLARFDTFFSRMRTTYLKSDLALADTVESDYVTFLDQVSASGYGDEATNDALDAVFDAAIRVLVASNDVLDYLYDSGVYALLIALALSDLDRKAKACKLALGDLEKELEIAKHKLAQSEAQTAVDLALDYITVVDPPVGFLSRGVIALGQMVLDTYVGADTSNAATWSSRLNTGIGAYADAFDEIGELTANAKSFTKGVGRTSLVIGFYFDANEVMTGYGGVKDVEAKMDKARKAYEDLKKEIDGNRASLTSLFAKLRTLRVRIESDLKSAAFGRRCELADMMKRTGYYPAGAYVATY